MLALEVKEGDRPPSPNQDTGSTSGITRSFTWMSLSGRPTSPSIYNHVAFAHYDFEPALKRVEASGFRHEYRDIPGTKLGVKIELQYPRKPRSR